MACDDAWYERITAEVTKVYDFPVRGGVCIDIGANIGAFSLLAKDMYKTIVAVEPCTENYNYMLKLLHGVNNVIPMHAAVWSESGLTLNLKAFSMDPSCPGYHSVIDWWREERGWNDERIIEKVPTISLEDLLKNYDEIDMLKIDTEGAEYEILYGKDLSKIKSIGGEFHLMLEEKLPILKSYIERRFTFTKYEGDGINENINFTAVRK